LIEILGRDEGKIHVPEDFNDPVDWTDEERAAFGIVKSAKALRKAKIREESRRVGELVAEDPQARAFYEDVGTPTAEL
jgi:hypothetical protein